MCVCLYRSENGIWAKERNGEEDGKQSVRSEGIDKMLTRCKFYTTTQETNFSLTFSTG